MERVLLLVDDEENIVRSLKRLFRRDGYRILTANSGQDGLELLKENKVGVIISDQRMPEMSGSEFLSKVKGLYPDTVRIVLSGYTDLNSVTDAINRGAIYRFLTKPWEDDLLRANVEEAFAHLEMARDNQRLAEELKNANALLADDNVKLSRDVKENSETLEFNSRALEIAHEVLEKLPVAVLGISDDGIIAVANLKAHEMLANATLVGSDVSGTLPPELMQACRSLQDSDSSGIQEMNLKSHGPIKISCSRMGAESASSGSILVLMDIV